jgi:hypothetical protein
MKQPFNITYDIIDCGRKRGLYNTSVIAADKDEAEKFFERFYPGAFLITCEPAQPPVSEVDIEAKEHHGSYADDDMD